MHLVFSCHVDVLQRQALALPVRKLCSCCMQAYVSWHPTFVWWYNSGNLLLWPQVRCPIGRSTYATARLLGGPGPLPHHHRRRHRSGQPARERSASRWPTAMRACRCSRSARPTIHWARRERPWGILWQTLLWHQGPVDNATSTYTSGTGGLYIFPRDYGGVSLILYTASAFNICCAISYASTSSIMISFCLSFL